MGRQYGDQLMKHSMSWKEMIGQSIQAFIAMDFKRNEEILKFKVGK